MKIMNKKTIKKNDIITDVGQLKNIGQLKKYLEDFNDNQTLDAALIKPITVKNFEIECSFNLNIRQDNEKTVENLILKVLKNTFGQKIEDEDISVTCNGDVDDD